MHDSKQKTQLDLHCVNARQLTPRRSGSRLSDWRQYSTKTAGLNGSEIAGSDGESADAEPRRTRRYMVPNIPIEAAPMTNAVSHPMVVYT